MTARFYNDESQYAYYSRIDLGTVIFWLLSSGGDAWDFLRYCRVTVARYALITLRILV